MAELEGLTLEECVQLISMARAKDDDDSVEEIEGWIAEHFEPPPVEGYVLATMPRPSFGRLKVG